MYFIILFIRMESCVGEIINWNVFLVSIDWDVDMSTDKNNLKECQICT